MVHGSFFIFHCPMQGLSKGRINSGITRVKIGNVKRVVGRLSVVGGENGSYEEGQIQRNLGLS